MGSAAHPVIPMCEIDFLGGGVRKKVTDLTVAIVTDIDASSSASTSLGESKKEEEEEETSAKVENEEEAPTSEVAEEKEEEEEETSAKVENEEEASTPEVAEEKEEEGNDETAAKVDAVEIDDKTSEEANDTDGTTTKSDVQVESTDEFEDAVSKEDEEELVDAKSEESDGVVVPTPANAESEEEESEKLAESDGVFVSTPASAELEKVVPDTSSGKDDVIKKEEEKEESKLQPSTTSSPATTTTTVLVPTCSVDIRVEFNPSPRDEKDALYDLLNKASKKKAMAIDRLRKAAAAMNQVKASAGPSSTMVTRSEAVKAGFLNKSSKSSLAKKEPMALVRWYRRVLGPQSLARAMFPVAKNYLLFFGSILAFHFQGYQLALPPPV